MTKKMEQVIYHWKGISSHFYIDPRFISKNLQSIYLQSLKWSDDVV